MSTLSATDHAIGEVFFQYLHGSIPSDAFDSFCAALDCMEGASSEERVAFAAFFLDAHRAGVIPDRERLSKSVVTATA